MAQSAVGAFQAGLRERPENLDFPVGGEAGPAGTGQGVAAVPGSADWRCSIVEAREVGDIYSPIAISMQRACRDFRRKKRQPKTLANDLGIIIRGGGQLLDGWVSTPG